MLKTRQIYEKFGTPQNLQEHMLRVTRVGILIADQWRQPIDKDLVTKAGLVHDLANIVKFKLELDSPLEAKQKEMREKYGSDDHEATAKMLQELGVDEKLIEIVQKKSFGNAIEVAASNNWPLKILFYSDMRVVPTGVVDLETRLNDVVTRLEKYRNHPQKDELMQSAREVEKQIQKMTNTKLDEINDGLVATGIEDLLDYEI